MYIFDKGCCRLPDNAICSCPTGTFAVLSTVAITQRLCIHIYYIKQNARSPAIDRTTETVWFYSLTLYKHIRTSSYKTYCEIMIRSEEHTSELQSRENLVCR